MSKPVKLLSRAALAASAALITLSLIMLSLNMISVAHADGVSTTNCFRSPTTTNCTTTWQRGTVDPYVFLRSRAEAAREAAESEERHQRWLAHCRPVIRHDQLGVAHYVYAARGCEFGRTDGARIN